LASPGGITEELCSVLCCIRPFWSFLIAGVIPSRSQKMILNETSVPPVQASFSLVEIVLSVFSGNKGFYKKSIRYIIAPHGHHG
jgi:hypothetical protein